MQLHQTNLVPRLISIVPRWNTSGAYGAPFIPSLSDLLQNDHSSAGFRQTRGLLQAGIEGGATFLLSHPTLTAAQAKDLTKGSAPFAACFSVES